MKNIKGLTNEERLIANTITSNDLSAWSMGRNYVDYVDEDERAPLEKSYNKVSRLSRFLQIGPTYDWKEERKMFVTIANMLKKGKFKYVYEGLPGTDSYGVIYSMIPLPKASRIV
jgi:hypothetical protein